jgi:collagenase-like PrtC family protease
MKNRGNFLSEDVFITIPCHWNRDVIKSIVYKNKVKDIVKVAEVYGVLAGGGPIGHGRTAVSVVDVHSSEAVIFRKFLKSLKLKFTYLLNAPIDTEKILKYKKELHRYLHWILEDLRPDALTITSLDLALLVRQLDKEIAIHISTIAGIKKAEDLNKYIPINPSRVVLHHDCGKHWSDLFDIVNYAERNLIDVEVLCTESCLLGCRQRVGHYKALAAHNIDRAFHTGCNSVKLIHPRELLLAGGLIRPEDLGIFIDFGVKYFKISGRSKPFSWLPEVVEAYQNRGYDGNLVRLMGIDPSLEAEKWVYLENKALDGFLKGYPQGGDYQGEAKYCDQWIINLYKNGNFKLLDGTEYEVKNQELVLKTPGIRLKQILRRDRKYINIYESVSARK